MKEAKVGTHHTPINISAVEDIEEFASRRLNHLRVSDIDKERVEFSRRS